MQHAIGRPAFQREALEALGERPPGERPPGERPPGDWHARWHGMEEWLREVGWRR